MSLRTIFLRSTNSLFLKLISYLPLQHANASYWISYNRATNQLDDCPRPCHLVQVAVGGMNRRPVPPATPNATSTTGEAFFYFAPTVEYSQEHFFYTFLSLMAEIGGYVGLLLGYSLLHIAMLISQFFGKKADELEEREMEGSPVTE